MEHKVSRILSLLDFPPGKSDLKGQRDWLLAAPFQKLAGFLLNLQGCLQQPSAQSVRDCAYHYVFMGAVALEWDRDHLAYLYCQQAADAFRRQNDRYNEALALWLAGLACERSRQCVQAQRLYQDVKEKIQQWAFLEGKERDENYHAILREINGSLSALLTWTVDISQPSRSANRLAFLALPSFPVFAQVQAGPDGPIWGETQQKELIMEIRTFGVGAREYAVFPLHSDRRYVALQRDRLYGWIVVKGNSMNAANSVPIVHDDLVLFYIADDADDNSIVVVSCPEPSGAGYRYMIKRWRAREKAFLSESLEDYSPIPRDQEHRILGVAVAVAKPVLPQPLQEDSRPLV